MIHYSCDLCGARLDGDDQRFVVKIDVYAADDEAAAGDSLDDLDEQFENLNDPPTAGTPDKADHPKYHGLRFDLCARCRRRYLSDPLFAAAKKRMG